MQYYFCDLDLSNSCFKHSGFHLLPPIDEQLRRAHSNNLALKKQNPVPTSLNLMYLLILYADSLLLFSVLILYTDSLF